ncbi:MAG TPA: diguanylate cyclase [Burkholderiaceae bacterium]
MQAVTAAPLRNLILIIDDDVDTIRVLTVMLSDHADILFATDGVSGISLARLRRPQLILLDVEMPGMNGYEVCRQLKSLDDTAGISLMFVTAKSSMEEEVAALEAGAVDFITKPLNPPVVRARVQTQLKLQSHVAALGKLVNDDGLTGIHNRRYFDAQLELEYRRHKRHGTMLALAMIDIDQFKQYNDGYGHQRGDACLTQIAQTLSQVTRRPGEIVARYGGEEFVSILPNTPADEAERYGAVICQRVAALQLDHGFSSVCPIVTVSVGICAGVPSDEVTAERMLAAADGALYAAKQGGRNRSVFRLIDAGHGASAG